MILYINNLRGTGLSFRHLNGVFEVIRIMIVIII
jgi:hypothetical protein